MPLTRKQRKEFVEGVAGAASAAGEAAVTALVDALDDSEDDDDMGTPKKALRGKYGGALKRLYEQLVDLVDASAVPLFRKHFSKQALTDFIHYLLDVKEANEVSLEDDDDDDDDDSDASFQCDEDEEDDDDEDEEDEDEEDGEEANVAGQK